MKKTYPTGMLALACMLGVGLMLCSTACNVLFPECRSDADCPDGEVCQNGVCVTAPGPECTTDADCANGEVCVNGVCEEAPAPECTTDADCAEGMVCVDGVCEEAPAPECTSNGDCAEGEVCEDGVCVPAVEEAPYETNAFTDDQEALHAAHADTGVSDCTTCHHSDPPAGFVSCTQCHSDNPNEFNSYKEVAHDQNESGDGCRACHDAEWSDNCAFCHTALLDM